MLSCLWSVSSLGAAPPFWAGGTYEYYEGATALPGATWQQNLAIEMALRVIDNPFIHDGLKRELSALLGPDDFSGQQMLAALATVIHDHSGIYIPPCLFPKPGLTCDDTKMNWILGGLAAVTASGKLVARASAEQAATSTLAAADATPL